MEYELLLACGQLITLINCKIKVDEISCGFAYFAPGATQIFRVLTPGQVEVAIATLPECAVDLVKNEQEVVLGDSDGPIILKRVEI
jgi:hypothetical protein